MTAATMHQTPAIPPRPARSSDKSSSAAPIPKVPARPSGRRIDRSISPSSDRFAPSPLNDTILARTTSHGGSTLSVNNASDDPIERSGSVPMPSVGEEGVEYSAVAEELGGEELTKSRSASPEQTRTVAEDLQLHAPRPSLPAQSAKQRVQAVTRTDSDRAASYGIGKPTSSDERAASRDGLRKKPSSIISTASDHANGTDDDHGIPEIGQRVPMNPNLGDVQAPSPGPGSEGSSRHHARKHSARGLPPGSYGLHGHGQTAQDKLDKAYYIKHPDVLYREEHTPLHDRQNDFAMSSSDLNKLVRNTISRGSGHGPSPDMRGTPTDEVAFHATDEYASRISSPSTVLTGAKSDGQVTSPLKQSFHPIKSGPDDEDTIHVDDAKHPEFISYGDEDDAQEEEGNDYSAPILAADEVGKDPHQYLQQPAVRPGHERRSSDDAPSRPSSRPASIYSSQPQFDFGPTPLEDVEEYEPLFPEETKKTKEAQQPADENKARRHFPSKDIWEDAPNSVFYTAEVTTPDIESDRRKSMEQGIDRSMTPAHAFAQHQEELAEQEANGGRLKRFASAEEKPTWVGHQDQFKPQRPGVGQRFPSRDVWEDAPDSQLQQTYVSSPPIEDSKPMTPARPVKKLSGSSDKPAIPERPKPKQVLSDDSQKVRPPVSDKPKPQVPSRPSKSLSGDSKDGESSKTKPPVPSRPVGGKIAALQAGFMSDLNKRLQLGPKVAKKEEAPAEEEAAEKEKAPLVDARKSRARGPQRRAPPKAASPAPSADAVKPSVPVLTFSMPQTSWAIHPEAGDVAVDDDVEDKTPAKEESSEQPTKPASIEEPKEPEKAEEPEEPETAEEVESSKEAESKTTEETAPEAEKAEETAEPPKASEAPEAESAEASHEPETEEDETEEPKVEKKTLAANMAGESVLEATVEKKDGVDTVEPVEVDDEVKS